METWYPKALRLKITTKEYSKNRGMPILAICDHITAGTDSRDWLQHADNGSSVHFLVRVENGKGVVYQFMPLEWAAWGNGRHSGVGNPYMEEWVRDYIRRGANPNLYSISIEHEGVVATSQLYTGPMLEATIALHKWIADTVPTLKRDRQHILGHYQFDHIDRAYCPGGVGGHLFPFNTIVAALNKPAPPPPAGDPWTDENTKFTTGFYVRGAFGTRYRSMGAKDALWLWGYPLSGEIILPDENGAARTCQVFEKAVMEWHPEEADEYYKVQFRRLGAAFLRTL